MGGNVVLYKKMINDMLSDIKLLLIRNNRELQSLPEGTLLCSRRKNKYYYYQYLMPRGFRKKEKRLGITENPQMIHALARKKLILRKLDLLQRNISCLEAAINNYEPVDERALISQMKGAYATLHPDMFTPLIRGNGNTQKYQFAFLEEDLKHITPLGLRVRSKSELVIAGRLEHFGLDLVYEPVISLAGQTFRPDFEIISKRTCKTVYWEHAGMMGDIEYMHKFQEKLSVYYEFGIVPWKNLILTYDNADGGLDVRLVDAMIKGWLL